MSTAKEHLTQYRKKKEEAISEKFKKKIRTLLRTKSKEEKMYENACEMICDEKFQSVLFKVIPEKVNVIDLKAKAEEIPRHVKAKAKALGSFLTVAAALYVRGNSQKRSQEFLKKVPGAAIPFVRCINQDIEKFRVHDYMLFQYCSEMHSFGDDEAKNLIRTGLYIS